MTTYGEVIGDPIAHSKSPNIHSHWLERSGTRASYRATRVTANALPAFLEQRRSDPEWRGCNVAMPLKSAACALVDDLDPVARRIGAVNTVIPREGRLLGLNTDWQAINLLLDMDRVRPQRAVIVGTGGSARAALEEMRQCSVKQVDLLTRSPERARALLAEFGQAGDVIGFEDVIETDLLINASPLGMAGYPPLDVDLRLIAEGGTIFDMVYAPPETRLLKSARLRGLRTIDGQTMLIRQASLAFAYFFGFAPNPADSPELRERLTS